MMRPGEYATTVAEAVGRPAGYPAVMREWTRRKLLTLASLTAHKPRGDFLRCFYCHYVFNDQVRDFERILVELQRVGTFVDSATCVGMATGRIPIRGAVFHISFDDGFRNNCTNALPVLRKLKIPALFFVPTAFVGADWGKAAQYATSASRTYRSPIEMATWDDLRAMRDAGHEIGSHTRSHVRLSDISAEDGRLHEEIEGSKSEIEAKLGTACRYISWPYGRARDIDELGLAVIRATGYEACFSAVRGSVAAGARIDPLRIPRHHFEPQWLAQHVRWFACRRPGPKS